jgi:hypothetical protein
MAYKVNPITGKMDMVGNVEEQLADHLADVTENNAGQETALDKKLQNHSFNNVIALSDKFASAQEASDHLRSLDGGFYPVRGQLMQYSDERGELHMMRYLGSCQIRPDGTTGRWGELVYDEKAKMFVMIEMNVGNLIVAKSSNGLWWDIQEHEESGYERWNMGASDPDKGIVFLSGNSSSELMYSKDGGFSWTKGHAPLTKTWLKVKFMRYGASEQNSLFFIGCNSTETSSANSYIYYGDDVTVPFERIDCDTILRNHCGYSNLKHILDFCVVCPEDSDRSSTADKIFLWNDNSGGSHLTWTRDPEGNSLNYRLICTLDLPSMVANIDLIYQFGNPYLLCYAGAQGKVTIPRAAYIVGVDYTGVDSGDALFVELTREDTHSLLNTDFGLVQLCHTAVFLDEKEITLPVDIASEGEYLASMAYNNNGLLMVVTGGHKHDSLGGNYAFLIDLRTREVINVNCWEEVLVGSAEVEGLLAAQGGKIVPAKLSDRLNFKEGKLDVDASDRYTAYKNYRLVSADSATKKELWSLVDLSEMVDGETIFYADEECTIEAGGCVAHSFNLNNPNDLIVYDFETEEEIAYIFQPSKIPSGLATTKALIEAMGGGAASSSLLDYDSEKPTKIATYNGWMDVYEMHLWYNLTFTEETQTLLDLTQIEFDGCTYPSVCFEPLSFSCIYRDENYTFRQFKDEVGEDGAYVRLGFSQGKFVMTSNKENFNIFGWLTCRFIRTPEPPK